ncbi:MAG: hypothetical protein U0R79_10735 [Propionicimonas sp.]
MGDAVTAGTVSTDSGLRIEVTATGEDTTLAGIRRLVEQAQARLLAGAAPCRPRRGLAVLVRARRRGRDRSGVDAAGYARPGRRPGDRPRSW